MIRRVRVLNVVLLNALTLFGIGSTTQGAFQLTSITHTEDFNFLSSTTDTTWVNNQATETATGSPGWYWFDDAGGSPYDVSSGTDATAAGYSFGSTGSSDRAMGNQAQSGDNDFSVWGITYQNKLSLPILQITVTYTGETWRNPDFSNTLTFNYDTSSTNIDTAAEWAATSTGQETPAGWTAVAALNRTEVDDGGASDARDGNLAANREVKTAIITFSTPVPVDGFFALRWYDANQSGDDPGWGIDDLTVTAAVPEPSAFLFGGLVCGVIAVRFGGRRLLAKLR